MDADYDLSQGHGRARRRCWGPALRHYVVAAPAAATVAVSVAEISAEFRSAEAARGCGLIREDWSFIVVNIRAGGRGRASTKW